MRIEGITQKIRNVRRLRQILHVLVKYGFGYLVNRLNIEQSVIGRRLFMLTSIKRMEIFDIPPPIRARKVLEELGPTFIKLGQILSTRPDLIPLGLCKEFEKLQDEVPAFEYGKVEDQIRNELGSGIDELFDNFSREPLGAASLAQVHTGELKTGENVVVKVQRPDIERVITSDLEILHALANLAEKHIQESKPYSPVEVIVEFRKTVLREIDFSVEANNIERFRKHFEKDDTVYIPKVFHSLSTKKVLTMERIDGVKISNLEGIEKFGLDKRQIAINGVNAVLKQIFVDGFFHADPHPGNIFVLEGNRIAFLDFGQVGRIHEKTKLQIANILTGIIDQDIPEIVEAFTAIGIVDAGVDIKKLELDAMDLMDRYYGIPLKELKMRQFLSNVIDVVSENRIKMPPDLFLLLKALGTIEGVGRKLDPDFNMAIEIKPFVEKLIRDKYSPKLIARDIRKLASAIAGLTKSFPKDFAEILEKIKSGTLRIEFEHKGLEDLISQMDKVSNRIAFSLIIAALVVGSSIIMQTDKGPILFGFPVLGVAGFVITGVMGLWLAIAILRSGKL